MEIKMSICEIIQKYHTFEFEIEDKEKLNKLIDEIDYRNAVRIETVEEIIQSYVGKYTKHLDTAGIVDINVEDWKEDKVNCNT